MKFAASPWTQEHDERLSRLYAGSVHLKEIAEIMGRSRASIRNRAYKLGITTRDDNWTTDDIEKLKAAYAGDKKKGELNLAALAAQFDRSVTAVCRKAASLGLTDLTRKRITKPKPDRRKYKSDEERSAARSARLRQRHQATAHPMLGRKHSADALEKISTAAKAQWENASRDKRETWTTAMLKGKLASQGTLAPPRPNATWKAGWREIGGKRNYYRSRWEANYARYLEWLKCQGEIIDWQHEPETFWFEAIKRGVRSYLPDFRVWEKNGDTHLHEVKGWMDARSKTTLKRMAKYHPEQRIILIRERDYNAIARKVRGLIEGWEHSERKDRL